MATLLLGDNRAALRQLAKAKVCPTCVYFDPPYNNGDRTFIYDDSVPGYQWIETQVDVAERVRDMLPSHGSAWYSIDDTMMHYLKVALDGVYGRDNYVTTICWEHRKTRENRAIFSRNHEYILVYAKNKKEFHRYRNQLDGSSDLRGRYRNPDNDPRGAWQSVSLNAQSAHATRSQFYGLEAPNGRLHYPPRGRCWIYSQKRMKELISDGRVYFGRDGQSVPRMKKFLAESELKLTPHTLWPAGEVGTTASAKRHVLRHSRGGKKVFDTPKPVELLTRIIEISTKPGDLVMDIYLGSGTTIEAAHLLGRRYIGVELLEEVADLCTQRLRSVLDCRHTVTFIPVAEVC